MELGIGESYPTTINVIITINYWISKVKYQILVSGSNVIIYWLLNKLIKTLAWRIDLNMAPFIIWAYVAAHFDMGVS